MKTCSAYRCYLPSNKWSRLEDALILRDIFQPFRLVKYSAKNMIFVIVKTHNINTFFKKTQSGLPLISDSPLLCYLII